MTQPPNTPLNTNESYLREQIHSALFADDFPILNDIEKGAADRAVAIILADRKKHELQARMDELERLKKCGYYPFYSDEAEKYTDSRLDELKQELEKL